MWNPRERLVLASKSKVRRQLLEEAAIPFACDSPNINERELESGLLNHGGKSDELPAVLAQAKALDVSRRRPGALCLGADQVLLLDGDIFHKAATVSEAEANLGQLLGRTHLLLSAFAIARNDQIIYCAQDSAAMTLRSLDPKQLACYLSCAGSDVLESVGGYMLEKSGVHLFKKIDGDHATILGLPMLKVLSCLRREGALLL